MDEEWLYWATINTRSTNREVAIGSQPIPADTSYVWEEIRSGTSEANRDENQIILAKSDIRIWIKWNG